MHSKLSRVDSGNNKKQKLELKDNKSVGVWRAMDRRTKQLKGIGNNQES